MNQSVGSTYLKDWTLSELQITQKEIVIDVNFTQKKVQENHRIKWFDEAFKDANLNSINGFNIYRDEDSFLFK